MNNNRRTKEHRKQKNKVQKKARERPHKKAKNYKFTIIIQKLNVNFYSIWVYGYFEQIIKLILFQINFTI